MADETRFVKKTQTKPQPGHNVPATKKSTSTSSSTGMGQNPSISTHEESDPLKWINEPLGTPERDNIEEGETPEDNNSDVSLKHDVIIPDFPEEMVTLIETYFPDFPEVVAKIDVLKTTCEYLAERQGTVGKLDSTERDEYNKALKELKMVVEYASSCFEAYCCLERAQNKSSQCQGIFSHDPSKVYNSGLHRTSIKPCLPSSTPTNVTVVQQQLRDHPGKLDSLSNVAVKAWIHKFQVARQQVPTLDRGMYIAPETKDMISFLLLEDEIIEHGSVLAWAGMS